MKKAFTLAEVLITLAIIGVVAAITIPSVIVNTNQMEFKTGLRKAVSVLNQAITLNKALTGESPYDNADLYRYLQQYMSVMKSKAMIGFDNSGMRNFVFYTTDGMRFEVPYIGGDINDFLLYESNVNITERLKSNTDTYGNCGAYGLTHNPDSTTNSPCIITVDVNGDRKPSPKSSVEKQTSNETYDGESYEITWYLNGVERAYQLPYSYANGRLLTDIFSIMITDQGAIPYGTSSQKAMYQAQK